MSADYRWADMMCPPCQHEVATTGVWPVGWLITGDPHSETPPCVDCKDPRDLGRIMIGSLAWLGEPTAIAVHEAGHAIVAHRTGLEVMELAIGANARHGSMAYCLTQGDGDRRPSLWGGYVATVALLREYRCDDTPGLIDAARSAMYDTQDMLPADRDLSAPARQVAGELIDEHWDDVLRLGRALAEAGRLDADQIARMIGYDEEGTARKRPARTGWR